MPKVCYRIGEQGGFLPGRWIEALRIRTEHVIDVIYTDTEAVEPSLHAQLLKGILLGKRSDLPTETLDIFRNSGTFHVLAVSGLHVGLVAMFCYFGFSRLRFPQKVVCLLTIAAVLIYACLIGFRPSVFRASLMAILFLFATLIDQGCGSLQSVGIRCVGVAPLESAAGVGCRVSTLFCRCGFDCLFRSENGETAASVVGQCR